MTKNKTIRASAKTKREASVEKSFFNKMVSERYQTLFSLGIIVILFLIFYAPMYFGGQTFESGDIVTSKSLSTYVSTHEDGYTLWNPYIFCGMPAYTLGTGFKWFNLIYVGITPVKWIFKTFASVEYATWSLYLILLGFTSFFLMKHLTRNILVSLFTAIAASFCTGIVVFLYIGHVTKLTSLCMYPLIFLMLLRFQKKITLLDAALLTFVLQVFVQGWHVQIIFYTLFAAAVYFIFYIIRSFIKKERELTKQLFKSAGVFAVASLIALLIQSDNLTQIYEYTPYSTRGGKSVVETKSANQGGPATASAYYDYHTQYSFSPGEILTFIIPSYYGFGNSVYNGPLISTPDARINTYFGQMEAVDVAMYMGVLVFFFALFAIITCWKDPFVQFLTILSVFSLLVSFGKTFSPVFDIMFDYFPYFDKFRVPSMMLVLVQLSFPILAGLGINKIIMLKAEHDNRSKNIIKYAYYTFTVLFAISVLLNGVIREWFAARLLSSDRAKMDYASFNALSDYISTMFMNDTMIAFALCALAFGLAYYYLSSKISRDLLLFSLIIFTIIDLWRIDSRGASYREAQDLNGMFNEPYYIKAVKSQNDKTPFRILNLKQDGSLGSIVNPSNYSAYFLIQDLYGYSGIKPRGYQDIMDVLGNPANPTLWRMLNVKYVIFDRPVNFTELTEVFRTEKEVVYKYDRVLPRAYFVNTIEKKPAIEILNLIKNNAFDPKETAYLEGENLTIDKPDTTAYAEITKYKDEHIIIDAKATGNNFLFLGDTYYPNGWKAFIDGRETKIYKANHNFRGIIVSKGEHKIEFIYAPESFYISRILSLSLSSLVIIGIIFGLLLNIRRKYFANIS